MTQRAFLADLSLSDVSRICRWMLRSIPGRFVEADVWYFHSICGFVVQALSYYVVLVFALNRKWFVFLICDALAIAQKAWSPFCRCSLSASLLHHLHDRSLRLYVESFFLCLSVI